MKHVRYVLNIIYFCVMLLVLSVVLLFAAIFDSKTLWKVFVDEYRQLAYYSFYHGLISEEQRDECLRNNEDTVAVLKSKGIM